MNSTDTTHQRLHLGIVNVSTVPSEEVINPMVCGHGNVQGIIRCLLRQRPFSQKGRGQIGHGVWHGEVGNRLQYAQAALRGLRMAFARFVEYKL
jgi:hypothetical protein